MIGMTTNGNSKKPRKERAQLSCTFCRHRKLKCDRQSPCANCTKRGQGSTCYFTHPRGGRIDKGNTTDVQSRVKHLENLVLGLMNGQHVNPLQTPSDSVGGQSQRGSVNSDPDNDQNDDPDQPIPALGKLNVSGDNTQYFGNQHWASILDDIAEVKQHLQDDAESPEDDPDPEPELGQGGPELLLGAGRMPTKEELLEELPPKSEVDRLVFAYFQSPDPVCIMFHRPSFQKYYEEFWADKSSSPLALLSLIFGIMALSAFHQRVLVSAASDEAVELDNLMASYRRTSAQALMLSNYTRPGKWTIEAMMVYNFSEYSRGNDTQMGLWIILGMTVRLAMRMGFHRDAKHFPEITPFDGEMRRRTWNLIMQLDVLSSAQFGLPRAVRFEDVDTEPPGNFIDSDLQVDMPALPAPRPDSQFTHMSYHILKGRLTRVFAKVSDTAAPNEMPSYDHTLRLDNDLTQVYDTMPSTLRVRRTEKSITDPSSLIFRRYTLDIMFHKIRCLLHRNYIVPARNNERYTFSLNCALSSAKAILQHQVSVYEETQPGGRLRDDRWLLSGLTIEDFTLAAMVICLSVDSLINTSVPVDESIFASDRREFITLIEQSYQIWQEWSQQPELSNEKSRKACQVLGIMLKKIHEMNKRCSTDPTGLPPLKNSTQQHLEPQLLPVALFDQPVPKADTPMSFSSLDPAMVQANLTDLPITDWMEAPQDINWDEWDDFFQAADPMEIPSDSMNPYVATVPS